MKNYFFIAGFMVAGLFLQASQGQQILQRIQEEKEDISSWEHTGPTAEDILAATKVENLAAKGSREDKLINAVKKGDLKSVETLIAEGTGLEARDNENMTPLMIAAEKGYTDIFRFLIGAGADVNAKDRFNRTAFFRAADKNHIEIVKIVIAEGGAIDRETLEGFLVSSASKGNTEMVKALIVESARMRDNALETAYSIAQSRRRSNPELFNAIEEALNKRTSTVQK